jgi:hypothetical protein
LIPAFKRLKLADRVLQSLQTNVGLVLDAIGTVSILGGVRATYTTTGPIAAFDGVIPLGHGLGRQPTGIITLLSRVPTIFYLDATPSATPTMVTNLKNSQDLVAGYTFTFWVF